MYRSSLWAVLGLAAMLGGCSASSIIDKLPAEVGLPAGAPARPQVPYEYPAVHDMPPERASVTMTEEEQVKLEKELANVRDRQEGRAPQDKKVVPATKKRPEDSGNAQPAGDKANP
ncbi:MAG TPA: hypothetical protein VKG24_10005 [Pseudolabrys sp.]|nr:hypothetical protein [Pseudolabrys sp.]